MKFQGYSPSSQLGCSYLQAGFVPQTELASRFDHLQQISDPSLPARSCDFWSLVLSSPQSSILSTGLLQQFSAPPLFPQATFESCIIRIAFSKSIAPSLSGALFHIHSYMHHA